MIRDIPEQLSRSRPKKNTIAKSVETVLDRLGRSQDTQISEEMRGATEEANSLMWTTGGTEMILIFTRGEVVWCLRHTTGLQKHVDRHLDTIQQGAVTAKKNITLNRKAETMLPR